MALQTPCRPCRRGPPATLAMLPTSTNGQRLGRSQSGYYTTYLRRIIKPKQMDFEWVHPPPFARLPSQRAQAAVRLWAQHLWAQQAAWRGRISARALQASCSAPCASAHTHPVNPHTHRARYTFWLMMQLLTSPKTAYRHTSYHKQTKNQWARDDPAFVVLCASLVALAATAYCVT